MKPTDNPAPDLVVRLLEHERQATRLSYLESAAVVVCDGLDKLLTGTEEKIAALTPAERIELETARHRAGAAHRSITDRRRAHEAKVPR